MENELQAINLLDLFIQGGWYIMVPLTLLLALAIFITIERLLNIRTALKGSDVFMQKIEALLKVNDVESAKKLCEKYDTPYSRMLEKGLDKIKFPLKDITLTVENAGKLEIYDLEDRLAMLATISGVAPMIGFLGTTIGMIVTFHQMSLGGVEIKSLSGGIMQAMVTTVGGLIVGIYAYLVYNMLVTKITKVVYYLENISLRFTEALEDSIKK
jgi:biopolymer transport protein ExbB